MLQIINQIFSNPLSVKQFYKDKPNISLFYIMGCDFRLTLKNIDKNVSLKEIQKGLNV